ncbi:hypothetical protein AN477_05375 [Alicyclobacillus ferrooxydans]|uniref:Uncharacterized protein n=1 Tax=Alicyclobacillus ferrooxydans TaxID=471514 RepID=A0A0P9F063_9BACL|nr:hypothetical protein AN477_05375 [Alicyclobacillus ferrooxydans]
MSATMQQRGKRGRFVRSRVGDAALLFVMDHTEEDSFVPTGRAAPGRRPRSVRTVLTDSRAKARTFYSLVRCFEKRMWKAALRPARCTHELIGVAGVPQARQIRERMFVDG